MPHVLSVAFRRPDPGSYNGMTPSTCRSPFMGDHADEETEDPVLRYGTSSDGQKRVWPLPKAAATHASHSGVSY